MSQIASCTLEFPRVASWSERTPARRGRVEAPSQQRGGRGERLPHLDGLLVLREDLSHVSEDETFTPTRPVRPSNGRKGERQGRGGRGKAKKSQHVVYLQVAKAEGGEACLTMATANPTPPSPTPRPRTLAGSYLPQDTTLKSVYFGLGAMLVGPFEQCAFGPQHEPLKTSWYPALPRAVTGSTPRGLPLILLFCLKEA